MRKQLQKLLRWNRSAGAGGSQPAENEYGRQLTDSEIRSGGHREFVGGMWEEIGSLQFDFLKKSGLTPLHRLVDIGCGCLRGGVYFVPYLEKSHYYGIDINASLIEAGRKELFKTAGISTSSPICGSPPGSIWLNSQSNLTTRWPFRCSPIFMPTTLDAV